MLFFKTETNLGTASHLKNSIHTPNPIARTQNEKSRRCGAHYQRLNLRPYRFHRVDIWVCHGSAGKQLLTRIKSVLNYK